MKVTAYVVIDVAEYQRRERAGMTAVTDPALLDRLMDLPVATPVIDPVIWAEMADQPSGIVERSQDGTSVTRRLESPLMIEDVVVDAAAGRELRAVQDASLFAGFTRRWVTAAWSRIPDATMLEAKLCGVGILDPCQRVLLPAEKPVALTIDGWSWLQQERPTGAGLPDGLRVMRRGTQLQPLAEPAWWGQTNSISGQRGAHAYACLAGFPPRVP